jgi:hypothetical protein
MWVVLVAAGFFGLIVPITLLRADRSAANTALTITTLLAVGVAVATTIGGNGLAGRGPSAESRPASAAGSGLPALACVDDLAGDTVLSACEKALFGSAESVAAAVSYAASQLERLTSYGDVASANKNMTADLAALRRAVERDRYGLIAHVLTENYRCTPADCPAFRLLSNRRQVMANMEAHAFDGVVGRYAASWNMVAPALATTSGGPATAGLGQAATTAMGPAAGTTLAPGLGTPLGPTLLTGKPTNAEFPTAASTPPVSIMNPEPSASPPPRSAPPPATAAPAAAAGAAGPPPAAKKPPSPKPPRTSAASAPVQLSPTAEPPPAVARE